MIDSAVQKSINQLTSRPECLGGVNEHGAPRPKYLKLPDIVPAEVQESNAAEP